MAAALCRAAGLSRLLGGHAKMAWTPAAAVAGAGRRYFSGLAGTTWNGSSSSGIDLGIASLLRKTPSSFAQIPHQKKQDDSFFMNPNGGTEMVGNMGSDVTPLTWLGFDPSKIVNTEVIEAMNRNARRPKRPNHGKRPCSHYARRKKRVK